MKLSKIFTITFCTIALSTTSLCYATELDTSILNNAHANQQNLLPDTEAISYGLIPNPFKIVTKTATAPIRAARSKIKAAQKAAKLTKKGVDTVKGIDGDAKGKGPATNYEKTPYTKDKYYRISKNTKSSKKSSRDRYEDYEFATNTQDTYESPYVKQRNSQVTIAEEKTNLPSVNTKAKEVPENN